eukprot:CAMPEP_0197715844 /NCGR_PEP_ID=MMETSP1434-20131217/927_1 /TAXON_ID=265543 /ORGANISM="Minutocellus polymorphus, Strain CCMP3303" /LENGTH=403 /DNA_ID=CAMNT_0043300085 /DNA_START=63 /DNA_END=1274 /DNA_ORIENTATION=-
MVQVSKKASNRNHNSTTATLLKHYAFLAAVLFTTATIIAFKILSTSDEPDSASTTSIRGTDSATASHSVDTRSGSAIIRGTDSVTTSHSVDTRSDTTTSSMRVGGILSAQSILSSGRPYLIYGTAWKEDQTSRLVAEAVKSGFRFIDTACQPLHYQENLVGEGWTKAAAELGLKREDLSLQTKFTSLNGQDPEQIPYDKAAPLKEQVEQSLVKSLENLQTDYLDSLLLHSPMSSFDDTMTVWRTFESFVDDGKVRRLGISNCDDYKMFTKLYDQARIKPSVLQNRFYEASGFDVGLRQFCKKNGITYQSFWTLTANMKALATPEIKMLAKEKKLSPQTLMYAFMLSQGHTPLDGTTDSKHMAEDVALMQRFLDGEELFNTKLIEAMADVIGVPRGQLVPVTDQ